MRKDSFSQIEGYLENPEHLLDDIDDALEQLAIEDLPLTYMSGDDEKSSSYRGIKDGRPFHSIIDAILLKIEPNIKEVFCKKLHYCELKKNHSATIDVAKAVFDGLIAAAVTFPIPIATVSAYCVQSLLLDRVCECADV